jgi:hypothetical protein
MAARSFASTGVPAQIGAWLARAGQERLARAVGLPRQRTIIAGRARTRRAQQEEYSPRRDAGRRRLERSGAVTGSNVQQSARITKQKAIHLERF